ncbi:MAG: UDP-N-acetylmuramoyl-tripeptide--D-alanyl-D-alanine ligase [Lachnospiraceae bacterium]|nr:UDP-N-acetylmuramoyl-tripeptide--D-alanyl-D-alanine ligase [Lachnospiraceae bacterium]
MLYRTIGMAVIAFAAWFLTMRYNLHMLQLNGYKNGEHLKRTLKTWNRQWLLMIGVVPGVVRIVWTGLWADIVCAVYLVLLILIYNLMRRTKAKKKLVYTARVKRMLAAHVIVSAILPAVVWLALGFDRVSGALVLTVSLQWILLVLTNFLMKPAEKAVGQHYINDAKRRLREMGDRLTIIGVTGSYGKTSVKFYLKTLLSAKYDVLVTPESFNTPMGVVRTIREQLRPSHEIFVCEMGARHVGDIKEICDIVHPRHGVITSIGPQHLETFFTMDNIRNTKYELADALPKGGMLFLNGDSEEVVKKSGEYPGAFLYHAADAANGSAAGGYYAKDIKVSSLGTEFTVHAPDGKEETFSTRLVGGHNVINIIGAIAVANQLGIALSDLKIPVRRLEPVPHRMQLIGRGAVTIIDDAYNSNPVGSKAAVETLGLFDGVKILVTPGMVELGEKEEEYNKAFGGYAAKNCDYICLVGRKRAEPIAAGVREAGFPEEKLRIFDRLQEALDFAYSIGDEGHKYILLENDLPDNY